MTHNTHRLSTSLRSSCRPNNGIGRTICKSIGGKFLKITEEEYKVGQKPIAKLMKGRAISTPKEENLEEISTQDLQSGTINKDIGPNHIHPNMPV